MIGQTTKHAHWLWIWCVLLLIPEAMRGQELKPIPLFPDSSRQIFIEIEIFRYIHVMPHALTIPPMLRAKLELFSNGWSRPVNLSGSLSLQPSGDQDLYMQTFWRDALRSNQKYETLWMVLGSMEAGGAAYVAYRHIKKYGLW